jgi:hypothetical protein
VKPKEEALDEAFNHKSQKYWQLNFGHYKKNEARFHPKPNNKMATHM